MAEGKTIVEKFDVANFCFLKLQIKDFQYSKDLYEPLEEKPKEMKEEEWKSLDRKAMSVVHLSLFRNIALHATKAKSMKEMLQFLSEINSKKSPRRRCCRYYLYLFVYIISD